MLSDLEIIDILYTVLNVTSVVDEITGEVCKKERPLGSDKEDVVIGCLPTNNLQLQTAIANINIHVPNITVEESEVQNSILNFPRLRFLTDLIIPLLTDVIGANWYITVQQQQTFGQDDIKQHYSNIRVEFYFINL